MDLVFTCNGVDILAGYRQNLELDIRGADLDDFLCSGECYDLISVDDFCRHHGLELKETD